MPRIRLTICGVTSIEEAMTAVEAGADAIGLDPSAFPSSDLAGNERLAEIALALPPTITPILLTQALTAGTIAQQVDAAAATAVQVARALPLSEYPGLKRIIRGRKIIQSIKVDGAEALKLADSYTEWADALHLEFTRPDLVPLCRQIADSCGLPVFLKVSTPATLLEALATFRPYAIDIAASQNGGRLDRGMIASLLGSISSRELE